MHLTLIVTSLCLNFVPFCAIGILSGNYEDDFESSLMQESLIFKDALDPGGTKEGEETAGPVESGDPSRSAEEEGEEDWMSTGSEDGGEGIAVGFGDISTLRESLEKDSVIKKGIVSSYVLP